MAGSIPVHLRHSCSGRNPSPGGSSMLGCWPEAETVRTGFAASDYLGNEIRALERPRFALRRAGGRARPNRLRSFGLISMIGCWRERCAFLEAKTVRTGFAASDYLGYEIRPRRHGRLWTALFTVCLVLIIGVGQAGASARLLSSSPVDGDSLAALALITFEFDSLLVPDGAEVTVTKLDGTIVAVGPATVDGSTLTATVLDAVPSGNYSVAYSVQSADGDQNTGAIRVAVNAPDQALSGGLIAVVAIAVAMFSYLAFVFRADQRRRRRS